MMSKKRLIDANAAGVESIPCYYGDHCTTEDVQEWLNEQPTVDAVEVVHGRWIETEEGTICSECHEHPFSDGYFAIANYNSDWCPNCGAKMDGGNENG